MGIRRVVFSIPSRRMRVRERKKKYLCRRQSDFGEREEKIVSIRSKTTFKMKKFVMVDTIEKTL